MKIAVRGFVTLAISVIVLVLFWPRFAPPAESTPAAKSPDAPKPAASTVPILDPTKPAPLLPPPELQRTSNDQPTPPPATPVPAGTVTDTDTTDLGEVVFTDGVPKTVILDGGQTCVITPTVVDGGAINLSMVITGLNASGETVILSSPSLTVRPGSSASMKSSGPNGSFGVKITPKLADN